MNTILYDLHWENLLPLTYTRPVAEIRMGIFTLREKWENYLGRSISHKTQPYLAAKFPIRLAEHNLLINANVLATPALAAALDALQLNQALFQGAELLGVVLDADDAAQFSLIEWEKVQRVEFADEYRKIEHPEQIFVWNGDEIRRDFAFITANRQSEPLHESNRCLAPENIFIEPGAKVHFATLNASSGPIYIGRNAEVMEGALLRGPLALCESAQIKMGAKVYPDSTFGPHCKVGGETNNVVLFGYSNKAHDGYLGNAVLGEWCNLGADTNNSNLKNDYTEVRIWDYPTESFRRTGLQFCGTIMGDHTKVGINTMLNTGTVIGVNANVYGEGFPRQIIPCFAWGGASGFQEYKLNKALQTARQVVSRRGLELSPEDEQILSTVFEMSAKHRRF